MSERGTNNMPETLSGKREKGERHSKNECLGRKRLDPGNNLWTRSQACAGLLDSPELPL